MSAALTRRRALGGVAASLGAVVAASGSAMAMPLACHPVQAEDAFWTAHARWQGLQAEWAADQDDTDENMDRWGERLHAAEAAMLLCPVFTAGAVWAKMEANDDPRSFPLPHPIGDARRMIQMDLQRIAAREVAA